MRILHFACLTFLLILLLPAALFSQSGNIIDSIANKMFLYARSKSTSTLFVHFDKNIYTNKETAWFTGYILKDQVKRKADVLSVALVRNDDRSVLAQGKFVMNKGLSQGNLFIPDSLPTGDYSFLCYTDAFVNDHPTDIFIQPVTIKTVNDDSFIAKLNFVDSLKPGMDSLQVRFNARMNDLTPIKDAEVKFYIGNRAMPLKSGTTITDKSGDATLSIPLKQIDAGNNHFQAEIRHGKEVQTFSLQLPAYKKSAIVKFYPEGGYLVDGLKSTIGWEVVNNEGVPLQVTASIYQDHKQTGTITTNKYGIGRFTLTPSAKSIYSVQLQTIEYARDTAFSLPPVLAQGPVATISNALADDTLDIIVTNKQAGTRWIGLIHDYKNILLTVAITANGNRVRMKIPLTGMSRGLYTFTLLDSLQRPWIERMFFANYSQRPALTISTNEAFYTIRQKVDVTLKVTDVSGKPLPSLVSIACASNSRFDPKKMTDIESYSYLTHELSNFPYKRAILSGDEEGKSYVENLLLVKGWRKYKWQELAAVEAKDTVQSAIPVFFTGNAYRPRKPLKKPVVLTLLKGTHSFFINTDSSGNFTIPQNPLILDPGQYLRLVVRGDDQDEFIINVTDLYKEWNRKLAPVVPLINYAPFVSQQSSQTALLDTKERAKELSGITITSTRRKDLYGNACGDYVCVNNVLNCPNHGYFGSRNPVVGAVYNTGKGKKVYVGCEGMTYLSKIDGIFTPKEFYIPASGSGSTSDGALASTIYWNHSLLTGTSGEARFSFSTNDLTGRFRIVVQGITGNSGAVYGELIFDVKEKE